MTKVTEGATPQRRRPGRPVRGNRPAMVRITVNLDPHLHAMLEGIADHVGIPASRVLNAILQTFHDAEYSSVDYGFVPGKESNMRIMSLKKWPQSPVTDVEGQS
jgi:hypothetical protein